MISGVRASSTRIEVDFVDDREVVPALDHLRQLVLHVVAQIVEAVFVVGAVGDVGGIGRRRARSSSSPCTMTPTVSPRKLVDLAHPFGVAAGEVVVDRDDVDALAGERVEIDRQRGDQRLAFAGPHLGDGALVQHHAADQLDVEMALAERAWRLRARWRRPGPGGRRASCRRRARPGTRRCGRAARRRRALEFGLQRIDRGRPLA